MAEMTLPSAPELSPIFDNKLTTGLALEPVGFDLFSGTVMTFYLLNLFTIVIVHPVVTTEARSFFMKNAISEKPLKRGALARQLGCNLETIRYYENIGIMPEPMRTQSGHRIYGQKEQERLRFILRCRELGFSTEELRRLLSMVDSEHYTCGEVHELTREYLQSVSDKIADLKKLQCTLKTISQECAGGDAPDCPIIEALYNQGEDQLSHHPPSFNE